MRGKRHHFAPVLIPERETNQLVDNDRIGEYKEHPIEFFLNAVADIKIGV